MGWFSWIPFTSILPSTAQIYYSAHHTQTLHIWQTSSFPVTSASYISRKRDEPEILEMWAPETSKSNHPPPAHGLWSSKALSPTTNSSLSGIFISRFVGSGLMMVKPYPNRIERLGSGPYSIKNRSQRCHFGLLLTNILSRRTPPGTRIQCGPLRRLKIPLESLQVFYRSVYGRGTFTKTKVSEISPGDVLLKTAGSY
ncbi:hypothetical protein TWF173_006762 [Orbilia oligospora]|nr:hypothetical protein TWF173_006762 [Orbilia oligospora]